MKEKELRKRVSEQIWLEYFNQMLFERGIISEAERNKLLFKIGNKEIVRRGKITNMS